MNGLGAALREELLGAGAVKVGFADLTALPRAQRLGLPVGVAVAVKYPKEIIRGILDVPTRAYYDAYHALNGKLDELVTLGAKLLAARGYEAAAQTLEVASNYDGEYMTRLPHKTVARLAGFGWIGKSALLVTREYGSMIRLSSILTDAPLRTDTPAPESGCGGCTVCTDACPGGAVRGKNWSPGTPRGEIFDAHACGDTAEERTEKSFGIRINICGRCIARCPYTQRYLNSEDGEMRDEIMVGAV